MNGKILGSALVGLAVIAGAALYYLQVYHFYEEVVYGEAGGIAVTRADGSAGRIAASDVRAIDANSSPIRFRACFASGVAVEEMEGDFQPYPEAAPLNAPGWFDCFDAAALGAALESGEARAFLGEGDVVYGVDRVIAVDGNGNGWAWHQINACGEKVFDGDPPPDGCAPPPRR